MSWFLLLLLPLSALLFLLPPLFRPQREKWDVPEARIETIEESKRMLVNAIRDLDFDYQMDKLTDEDYQAQREKMKLDLAEAMQRLKKEEKRGNE